MNQPDRHRPPVGDGATRGDGAATSPVATAHLANVRDLGGLPTGDGGRIRPGTILRGDASYPGDGPPPGVSSWPPSTVVDLRSPDEQQFPFTWPAGTSVHSIPLLAALAPAVRGMASPGGTRDLYLQILEQSAGQLARIVQVIANAPGATLLHCTMGRDRTGVAIAVVLLGCGVDIDTIVADYETTRPNLSDVLARLRAAGMAVPPDEELPPHALALDATAIDGVLTKLTSEPGGVVGWLGRHGATESDVQGLRARLVG